MNKEEFKSEIETNIKEFGYHVTYVIEDITPAFVYTIGLTEKFNIELVFAGGVYYRREEKERIITNIADKIMESNGTYKGPFDLEELGLFSLSPVDESWAKLLLLGVYDIYKTDKVIGFQIIPDTNHYTLDIPKMSQAFNVNMEPVWQWMVNEWEYNVPKDSTVGTDLDFLMGAPLTEIARWELNYWEMYNGDSNDMPSEKIRLVSLGTVLAIDPSTKACLDLPLEKGLLRDGIGEDWRRWRW